MTATPVRAPARGSRRAVLRIGGVEVPGYNVMLYLGCVAGVLAGSGVARAQGLEESRFALAAVALLVPALVGARLWFVAQHFEVFRADPRRVFARGEGGSTLYGGFVLAVLSSVPLLRLFGIPFWAFWDAASVTMLVGMILGRAGCLMTGCCCGRRTNSWLGVRLPNHRGEWERRFPTPLLEAGWSALILVAVLSTGARAPFPGALFASVSAAYAAGRVVMEFTRETSNPRRSTYLNVAFSAILLVAAGVLLGSARP